MATSLMSSSAAIVTPETSSAVAMFEYVDPSELICHASIDSFHLRTALFDVPRSISIPASADGELVTELFKTIILSSTLMVSVLRVVVFPLTIKFPVTVKSWLIVTFEGRPSVMAPAEAETSTSFAVPVNDVTAFEERSLICEAVIEIVELPAAVNLP